MKKITLSLIAVIAFGCSSDGDSEKPISNTDIKLVKEIYTDLLANKSETIVYNYENGFLTNLVLTESNGDVYKTEFVYEYGKLKTEKHYENSIPDGTNTYTYTGPVVSSSLSFEDNMYFLHNYTYNSNNKLLTSKQYHNNILEASKEFEYTSQGNMFKIIDKLYPDLDNTTYEFDDKKNPYSLLYSEAILNSIDEPYYSKNNLITVKSNNVVIANYEYIYNDKNYPTQMIEKDNGVARYKTTFIYE